MEMFLNEKNTKKRFIAFRFCTDNPIYHTWPQFIVFGILVHTFRSPILGHSSHSVAWISVPVPQKKPINTYVVATTTVLFATLPIHVSLPSSSAKGQICCFLALQLSSNKLSGSSYELLC